MQSLRPNFLRVDTATSLLVMVTGFLHRPLTALRHGKANSRLRIVQRSGCDMSQPIDVLADSEEIVC
jgi:hypothetical protein